MMEPFDSTIALKEARKRIGELENTLLLAQQRLTRAPIRIEALERSLRTVWAGRGSVQGRR
jgi:hypothetical protein